MIRLIASVAAKFLTAVPALEKLLAVKPSISLEADSIAVSSSESSIPSCILSEALTSKSVA
jgi:hypothetical protein